jgi:riboflavin synthase
MFTGLVEAMGTVQRLDHPFGDFESADLVVEIPFATELAVGDSVAIDGCCLTVVAAIGHAVKFQCGPETLKRTTLGRRVPGDAVNLERALRADQRLGGHFVQGHIDGTGEVVRRDRSGEWEIVWFKVGGLMSEIVSKGSVAVDGVSLTVVETNAEAFSVMLIPHTLAVTTLGRRPVGSFVNIETDVLAKYVSKIARDWATRKEATP